MKLGDVIYSYRMEHGYSMRQFSNLCKMSPAQVYFMERGLNSQGDPFIPKAETLRKVASAMGITLNELISVCDDMTYISVNKEDMIDPAKQELIDRILMATPEQLEKIKSIIDIVLKS